MLLCVDGSKSVLLCVDGSESVLLCVDGSGSVFFCMDCLSQSCCLWIVMNHRVVCGW